jgi:glycosyltransferase involved in cell wall biosynthesis
MTVHLIYPHGPKTSCPDAIGREVGKRLAKIYPVVLHDWDEFGYITPREGDVLVGHACPIPCTVFKRSAKRTGWRRVVLLSPHCHGDPHQPAFNDRVLPYCDVYLAITGNYWFNDLPNSLYAHWLPKMVHVDLAVDRSEFPVIKTHFNRKGLRRAVYIGSTAWYKNTDYLSRVASEVGFEIAWIGTGTGIPGTRALGRLDFSTSEARRIVAEFDFLLTVGRADGNPATILEAMAWGLIPVCTPQSGYIGYAGIINVPPDDAERAVATLRSLQEVPDERLYEMQASNWELLDHHFNWDRFTAQVVQAIQSSSSYECPSAGLVKTGKIRAAEVLSPFWVEMARPSKLRRRLSVIGSRFQRRK